MGGVPLLWLLAGILIGMALIFPVSAFGRQNQRIRRLEGIVYRRKAAPTSIYQPRMHDPLDIPTRGDELPLPRES